MKLPLWAKSSDTLYHHASSLLLFLLTVRYVSALNVVPGSNCTSVCSSTSTAYNTNGSDIVCHDKDYNSTVVGAAFQDCVSCEIQSAAINPYTVQTNVGWALCKPSFSQSFEKENRWLTNYFILDNLRYTLDWCLFSFPNNGNQSIISSQTSQCLGSCTKISNALEINILTPNATTTYGYCQDPNFLPNVKGCASCFAKIPNQLYFSNCKPSTRGMHSDTLNEHRSQPPGIRMQISTNFNITIPCSTLPNLHLATSIQLLQLQCYLLFRRT